MQEREGKLQRDREQSPASADASVKQTVLGALDGAG